MIVALAFSDLHLNDWSKFNQNSQRTMNHFMVLTILQEKARQLCCPLIFCGDLFHKPESISQELLNQTLYWFRNGLQQPVYAISGNHDIINVSKVNQPPLSWNSIFSEEFRLWINLDYSDWCIGNTMIHGVPYIDHNIGLSEYLTELIKKLDREKKHILLLHTDYPGARDTDGRSIDSVENLNLNLLNKFDLVLCGHIHKPQKLSKKVYMIGAPLQQRRTDRDCKLGYWEIHDDLSVKFVELKGFPKFIDVESADEIKDDGNYYTIVNKSTSSEIASPKHKITKQLTKTKLAKQYLIARGIADKKKEELLIKLLKRTDQ